MATLAWTIVFLIFMGLFCWQIRGRFTLLKLARRDDLRNYTSDWGTRLKLLLVYGFGQKKFLTKDQPAGVLHLIVFWGFVILLIQVITTFMRGWIPGFTFPGFSAALLGGPYGFVKDIFQLGVLIAACVFIFRWAVTRPTRLFGFLPAEERLHGQSHWEAYVILLSIALIMVSGFFYDAGRMVFLAGDASIEHEKGWQPLTLALSHLFNGNSELAKTVSDISWWTHNIVILVFLNLLPRSKHFHIITALPNVFFGKIEPKGRLPKKDFEADDALFGRSKPEHFTWKQVLDMFSCTECGRCSAVCPATITGKPLGPRQFLLDLRDNLYAQQESFIKKTGTDGFETDVVVGEGKAVNDDVIWACNACRACEQACPVNIEFIDKIIDIRQHLVQEVARFPEELNRTFKGLETQSNPWGISSEERASWAQGLDVPLLSEKPDAEYLFYVGCGGAFDTKNKKHTQALAKILNKAGVSYAILGNSEHCNGETARRLGNEYLFSIHG